MAKRLFDLLVAATAIVLLSPILLFASIGIRCTSPGPVFYRAQRMGLNGTAFVMYKFRTMHVARTITSVITAANDNRVFLFGRLLRTLKIDELPQLMNVLAGDMSIVGPRPEDQSIVEKYYGRMGMETLSVRPGLASPGSIYNYTHGEQWLVDSDPVTSYVQKLLPVKLALEFVYVQRRSLRYDVQIILRTAITILLVGIGRRRFPDPPEMAEAQSLLATSRQEFVRL